MDSIVILDFPTHLPSDGSILNKQFRDNGILEDSLYRKLTELWTSLNQNQTETVASREMCMNLEKENIDNLILSIINNDNGIGYAAMMSLTSPGRYPGFTYKDWETLYPDLPPFLKATELTKKKGKSYMQQALTAEGMPFVDIEGKDPEGNVIRLSDYVGKGKYVLADFWASWCAPCKQEAENILIPLYERMKDKDNFEILGISTWDEEQDTRIALETFQYGWKQMLGNGQEPMDKYGFNAIPMIILFGPDGTILRRGLRGDDITEAIDNFLGK